MHWLPSDWYLPVVIQHYQRRCADDSTVRHWPRLGWRINTHFFTICLEMTQYLVLGPIPLVKVIGPRYVPVGDNIGAATTFWCYNCTKTRREEVSILRARVRSTEMLEGRDKVALTS